MNRRMNTLRSILGPSPRTAVFGFAAAIGMLLVLVALLFGDADGARIDKALAIVGLVLAAAGVGGSGLSARDNRVTSEDVKRFADSRKRDQ